jgi:IS30 family transposase
VSYHQITREQRCQIKYLISRRKGHSEIAREIGWHRSTVHPEVKRNSLELWDGTMEYDVIPAQSISEERRKEACEGRYKTSIEDAIQFFKAKSMVLAQLQNSRSEGSPRLPLSKNAE